MLQLKDLTDARGQVGPPEARLPVKRVIYWTCILGRLLLSSVSGLTFP